MLPFNKNIAGLESALLDKLPAVKLLRATERIERIRQVATAAWRPQGVRRRRQPTLKVETEQLLGGRASIAALRRFFWIEEARGRGGEVGEAPLDEDGWLLLNSFLPRTRMRVAKQLPSINN